jgi:D-psicose/D-tagatose/L-ribulose 3-epimerase
MKIGVSAFAWSNVFRPADLEILPRVRDLGFEGFEIPMFFPGDLAVAELRRGFEANGLACTICAILPPGINPISPDAETRKRSREHLASCIKTAAELGAHLLGGPLFAPIGYLPGHRPTADEWAWAVEAFQSVAPLLEQHAVTLSIEPVNRSETFLIRTAEEALRLCGDVASPHVGVTIDTFHANIEEKSIPAALQLLGTRLTHVHLSENDRGLLGSGHVDFPQILSTLRAMEYEGFVVIEGFGYSPDRIHAPGWLWADPAVSPDDLAASGMAYLRQL